LRVINLFLISGLHFPISVQKIQGSPKIKLTWALLEDSAAMVAFSFEHNGSG
jgi:hypothetical protein